MFELEDSTIWSFSKRDDRFGHNNKYRGNWAPQVPRNIILRYSSQGDWVLDQFLGGGTTAIECKLLNRNFIGVDINEESLKISELKLKFQENNKIQIKLFNADSTKIDFIKENSIDLICTHLPYSNIIKYSDNIKGDLSLLTYEKFLKSVYEVAKESYRVLKKGKYCAIMVGDLRKNKCVVPLGFNVLNIFLKNKFLLKEIIIKEQFNCKMTDKWKNVKRDFLLLAHEYIFIFYK